ncbi:hypothetical protein DACRYDRAFT_13711 [Dacryopinax primogenitus]|uniref:Sodium/calcium exchanger membrane region domain-containing protein n=1 Tax=Dacryopinax primogenitus (strain DJM 731) TaxID=1858805 RepID=M5GBM8_DACPD|nr:uncharacterized protein DACRYDRAFT_13711 [Dacryopinax primogenitus]EJU05820.1 hypothetical protein DACRYDRAFT_13711 [Dacryopinax primogenitus]
MVVKERLIQPLKSFGCHFLKNLRVTLFATWLNIMLLPLVKGHSIPDLAIFVCTFTGIIPLGYLMCQMTEKMEEWTGRIGAGLLNAAFGNAVIGSVISNLLLVLGTCFFVGGIRFSEQGFLNIPSQISSVLLMLSAGGRREKLMLIILQIAVILLIVYAFYLYFTLASHANVVNAKSPLSEPYPPGISHPIQTIGNALRKRTFRARGPSQSHQTAFMDLDRRAGIALPTRSDELRMVDQQVSEQEGTARSPVMTGLVGVTSECLVSSISGVTASGVISEQWIGLILLPIAGNVVEHITAVVVAWKDKQDMSIAVAVGSALQICQAVIPIVVIIAWIMGIPLSFFATPLLMGLLVITVLLVNYTMADSKSNWLEGVVLIMVFWYYQSS